MTSSEQARADALADAETLLYYATTIKATRGARRELVTALDNATFYGSRAARFVAKAAGHWSAFTAARAAFRAVPGLRG